MKIEERLNFLCEARNFLNAKDKRLGHLRTQEKDIETFEKDLARERMDKIVREKQNEQKQQIQMHEKMLLKQEKLKNLKVFKGHHLRERS